MLELTPETAADYLRARGLAGPFEVETLTGGVSNQVLRVTTPEGRFVLKQSRPQLRTQDAWFSDLGRVVREWEVMQALEPLLPEGTVPHVLFTDRDNYAYGMSHAPEGAAPWKADLLAGTVDASLGEQAGRALGRMHDASARSREPFAAFADHTAYVQLRVDPFYRRVQERRPEVAEPVGRIVEQMLSVKEALCHGDYTPKNMLVHGRGFTLVDYETAHLGDPTMDLGLFLAHVTLKAFRLPTRRRDYYRVMQSFWRGYTAGATFKPADELERRGVAHLGVCLLARVDGTSPVEYLPDEAKRDAVRRLGRSILQWDVGRWDDARGLCEQELLGFVEE